MSFQESNRPKSDSQAEWLAYIEREYENSNAPVSRPGTPDANPTPRSSFSTTASMSSGGSRKSLKEIQDQRLGLTALRERKALQPKIMEDQAQIEEATVLLQNIANLLISQFNTLQGRPNAHPYGDDLMRYLNNDDTPKYGEKYYLCKKYEFVASLMDFRGKTFDEWKQSINDSKVLDVHRDLVDFKNLINRIWSAVFGSNLFDTTTRKMLNDVVKNEHQTLSLCFSRQQKKVEPNSVPGVEPVK